MKHIFTLKRRWILLITIVLLFIYLTERRRFYYTDDGKCFTVWKTWNDCCYTMPYKYYGLIKPSDNYIQTNNTACIDIFWTDSLPNDLIVRASDHRSSFYIKIINNKPKKYYIYNYYDDEEKYKKMLFDPNSEWEKYLNGIDIDISWNYLIRKYLSDENQQKFNKK